MEKSINVPKPDGWTSVDPSHPHVIAIAESAVKEHNKTADIQLVFVAVVEGWKLDLKDTTYKLTVAARHDFTFPPFPYPYHYEVVVYEDSSCNLQFEPFAPLFTAEGPPSNEGKDLLVLWKEMENAAAGEKTIVIDGVVWTIVNPNDPTVIEVGEFAVAKRSRKTGTKLEFVGVVSGLKLQFPVFNFYALLIEAKDGVHKALVFKGPLGYKKLLFWMN